MRKWIVWLVSLIWVGTAIAVLVVSQIHPNTLLNATLTISEIPFHTNATRILNAVSEREVLVSRIASVQIDGASEVSFNNGPMKNRTTLSLRGDEAASCTFFDIRSDAIELSPPTQIILSTIRPTPAHTSVVEKRFALRSHGPVSGHLTSQPEMGNSRSGMSCTRMVIDGASIAQTVEAVFPVQGGDSIHFSTQSDSTVDFRPLAASGTLDTTIPVIGELRLSRIDRASNLEKTVLLKPALGDSNQLSFERLNKKVDLDFGDLLTINPASEFYIREFTINDIGFQLSLHGQVKDVHVGAGPNDLQSHMPSLLDSLIHDKEYYALIPAIVALIVGILEKMRVLPGK